MRDFARDGQMDSGGLWLGLAIYGALSVFAFLEKGKCSLVLAFSASLVFPFLVRLFPCFMRGFYGSAKSEIVFKLLAINW